MTVFLYIKFIIYAIIAFLLAYLVQIPFRKIKNRFLLGFLFIAKVLLTLYLGLQIIAFDAKIVWNHEYVFGALYMVLVSDIFRDIICFIMYFFRKGKDERKLKLIISAVVTVLFISYNMINMETITPKYHEISSPKLKHEYTVVFFADLHYGYVQTEKTVDRALEEIKQLEPDCLLLGGDITDENTTKEDMEIIYQKIGSLGIPVYYAYGNHDRQDRNDMIGVRKYTESELENAIAENGIKILYEDYTEINDDLILMGREDPSRPENRKAVKDLPAFPADHYVIVLDHTPYQDEDIIGLKADLQLSGHTHAAQFFPIRLIYRMAGLNSLGDYQIGDTHLYVTPGIGGWYLPLRSESHCHYEVFTLKPE